jgi:hypothetical protein
MQQSSHVIPPVFYGNAGAESFEGPTQQSQVVKLAADGHNFNASVNAVPSSSVLKLISCLRPLGMFNRFDA